MRRLPFLFLLLVWLPSCQALPAPQTPAQSLAAAESAATLAIHAAATAREQGLITPGSDAETYLNRAIRVMDASLDAAQGALRAGRTGEVADWIAAATQATHGVNSILKDMRR